MHYSPKRLLFHLPFAAALATAACLLRFGGLQRTKAILARTGKRPAGSRQDLDDQQLAGDYARRISAVARRMPFWTPTCLQKSLALWWLLRRHGIVSELQLGIKKNPTEFSSHAWVELGDWVVNDCERITETYQKLHV